MSKTPPTLRILLVEDNEYDRLAFRRTLQKGQVSCEITECMRAEEALELLHSDAVCSGVKPPNFDLLVIDHSLPGMSGFALCKELVDEEAPWALVLITGTGTEQLAVEALKAGVDDYLVKAPDRGYLELLPVVLPDVVRKHVDRLARKRAEEALQQSEERARALLAAIPDSMFLLNKDGVFLDFHAPSERELYMPPGEFLGKHITEVLPKEMAELALEHIERVLWTGEVQCFEYQLMIGGEQQHYEARIVPCGEENTLTIARNITERRQIEEELKKYRECLEELVEERTAKIREINEQLRQEIAERKRAEEARMTAERELEEQRVLSMRTDRLRSLGEMAAGIAHELNQPLVGVRGLAEHLLIGMERGWDVTEKKLQDNLTLIIEQADRMSHIVEHIRMFAREAGKPELLPVQVNDVVKSAMDMLNAQFRSRGLELECELTEPLPLVSANPFSLEEVVLNLIINARDAVEEHLETNFSSTPPRVLVRTLLEEEGPEQRVNIKVIDCGVGIPQHLLLKVFEPFFTTKGPDRGTGLGLSISKSIVEQFGGTIHIKSTPGQGTTVIISLRLQE